MTTQSSSASSKQLVTDNRAGHYSLIFLNVAYFLEGLNSFLSSPSFLSLALSLIHLLSSIFSYLSIHTTPHCHFYSVTIVCHLSPCLQPCTQSIILLPSQACTCTNHCIPPLTPRECTCAHPCIPLLTTWACTLYTRPCLLLLLARNVVRTASMKVPPTKTPRACFSHKPVSSLESKYSVTLIHNSILTHGQYLDSNTYRRTCW